MIGMSQLAHRQLEQNTFEMTSGSIAQHRTKCDTNHDAKNSFCMDVEHERMTMTNLSNNNTPKTEPLFLAVGLKNHARSHERSEATAVAVTDWAQETKITNVLFANMNNKSNNTKQNMFFNLNS